MVFPVASRAAKSIVFAAALVGAAGSFSSFAAAADRGAGQWPAQVRADYAITFNGFDIGDFRLKSTVADGRYVVEGDAKLSALLGAFTWRGITRSSGRLTSGAPRPEGYVFNFKSNAKNGMIGMSFGKSGVKTVTMVPQIPVGAGEVPLQPQHLRHVFDPLSAVMQVARGVRGKPCAAKIPVFDGKQRFDLELSYRRIETMPRWKTGGRLVRIHVCGVRYRPVAGFAPNQATRAMAKSRGIELAMRRVPGTKLFIPHQITIPTLAGSVVLAAKKIDVLPAGARRVAQAP